MSTRRLLDHLEEDRDAMQCKGPRPSDRQYRHISFHARTRTSRFYSQTNMANLGLVVRELDDNEEV